MVCPRYARRHVAVAVRVSTPECCPALFEPRLDGHGIGACRLITTRWPVRRNQRTGPGDRQPLLFPAVKSGLAAGRHCGRMRPSMSQEFFPKISQIKYEGPKTKNRLAFRH